MLEQHRIAIIGAGTMGRTIATGLVRGNITPAHCIAVTDHAPGKADALAADLDVRAVERNDEACRDADIVMICVKPKDVADTLRGLREHNALWPRTLLLSIAAGVTTHTIERLVGTPLPVVRAMPNTPCLVGHGMTVVARGAHATDEHLGIAHDIFATLGRCRVLEEKHMDVVTGLSGSGPAFIYTMLEALADGGVMCGLPRSIAIEMVAQVALGAASMILTTNQHPAALRDDVTTPGGCTIAGLLALEDGKIRSVLARAVETATNTAARLGGPAAGAGVSGTAPHASAHVSGGYAPADGLAHV